jgi:AraC-like DNA-binding protein
MEVPNAIGDTFLERLIQEVDGNLTNEQFGVEELARKVGMSRSQLHRKLSSATGQSVSQFIREYRLQRGMDLLKMENSWLSK